MVIGPKAGGESIIIKSKSSEISLSFSLRTSLGFSRGDYEFNIYHVLIGSKKLSEVILKTSIENLSLAPSNIGLVGIEKEFYNPKKKNRELVLKEKLKEISDDFDFIIIDSPPALGPITINALSASDS
ncbi:MAG: hypothetical protein DSZ12_01570, partial [Sulfurovum sp.]